jgi:phosphate-selective porin OprO/OprP
MHPLYTTTVSLALACLLAATAMAAETGTPRPRANGDDNPFSYRSSDGNFKADLNGRLHVDTAQFNDDITPEPNDTDIRRLRIGVSGEIEKAIRFNVEGDVAGTSTGWKNVWLSYTGIDGLEVRGGSFTAPFSLEDLRSSNGTELMERSLAQSFAPGFLVGGMVKVDRRHWTVSAGYFGDPLSADSTFNNDAGRSLVARVTLAPIAERNRVLHFGAAIEKRTLDNGVSSRIRVLPESALAANALVTTRTMDGINSYTNLGLEAGFLAGPFSMLGQYVRRTHDAPALRNPTFTGGYVQAAWVVTGESRGYTRSTGVFGNLRPNGDWGAVELAARYSQIDLTSGSITGGKENNTSFGVNWYLGRYVRLMANYVRANAEPNRNRVNETLDIIEARAQVAF